MVVLVWWLKRTTRSLPPLPLTLLPSVSYQWPLWACRVCSSQRSCAVPIEPSAQPAVFVVSRLMPSTPSAMRKV